MMRADAILNMNTPVGNRETIEKLAKVTPENTGESGCTCYALLLCPERKRAPEKAKNPAIAGFFSKWHPLGESNPSHQVENLAS